MRIALDFNAVLVNTFSGFYSYGTGLLWGFGSLSERIELMLFYSKRFGKEAQKVRDECLEWAQLKPTTIKMRWLEDLWRYSSYPKLESFTGAFDIYHCFHHLMPATKCGLRMMTVHDLRRYKLPELYKQSKLDRFELAVKRAEHFIAVSESTKNDLCSIFDISEDKVDVVYLAAGEKFMPLSGAEKARIKTKLSWQAGVSLQNYVIAFSSPDSRKNIWRIIRAFKVARKQLPADMKLVIIGNLPKYNTEHNCERMLLEDQDVILAGTVNNVTNWLGCADGLIFASLYEGFGIPILEAFACGIPVITSNLSSMPEVAGDAALLVDPYDAETISQAIIKMFDDGELRNKLIETGLRRSSLFSWHKTASETLEVYKKLL